jgi:hypothetical protein
MAAIPPDWSKYNPNPNPNLQTHAWLPLVLPPPAPILLTPATSYSQPVVTVPLSFILGGQANSQSPTKALADNDMDETGGSKMLTDIGMPHHTEMDEWMSWLNTREGMNERGVPAPLKRFDSWPIGVRGSRSEAWNSACLLRWDPELCQ